MTKHIEISEKAWKELRRLKIDWDLNSLEEVVDKVLQERKK